jgi:hypothetical protein
MWNLREIHCATSEMCSLMRFNDDWLKNYDFFFYLLYELYSYRRGEMVTTLSMCHPVP